MSSSNTETAKSSTSAAKVAAASGSGSGLSALLRVGQMLGGALKGGVSPLSAALKGSITTGRFLAYTTMGRVIIVMCLLLGTFSYFKAHFTQIERHKWTTEVQEKQKIIVGKVGAVNAETKKSQDMARAEVSWLNKILGVVSDSIWKVQPPHPIEEQTIDLINETRGKKSGAGH